MVQWLPNLRGALVGVTAFSITWHLCFGKQRCQEKPYPNDQLTLQWFRVNEPVVRRGVLALKMTPGLWGVKWSLGYVYEINQEAIQPTKKIRRDESLAGASWEGAKLFGACPRGYLKVPPKGIRFLLRFCNEKLPHEDSGFKKAHLKNRYPLKISWEIRNLLFCEGFWFGLTVYFAGS